MTNKGIFWIAKYFWLSFWQQNKPSFLRKKGRIYPTQLNIKHTIYPTEGYQSFPECVKLALLQKSFERNSIKPSMLDLIK